MGTSFYVRIKHNNGDFSTFVEDVKTWGDVISQVKEHLIEQGEDESLLETKSWVVNDGRVMSRAGMQDEVKPSEVYDLRIRSIMYKPEHDGSSAQDEKATKSSPKPR